MRKLHVILYASGSALLLLGIALALLITPGEPAADAPFLERYLTEYFDGTLVLIFVWGGGLILANALYLIFARRAARECSLGTSLLSMGTSFCVGVGMYCAFTLVMCIRFSTRSYRHPIAIPAAFSVGTCALIGGILLACFYVKRRRGQGMVGFMMDVWSGLVFTLPCFFSCAWLHDILSAYLRTL